MSIQRFTDSHMRWRAITKRDPAAHFAFLYGVTSTKIYCRPTCTARCARRANVVFYDTAEQAQSDGFRACRRCKPDEILYLGDREETVGQTLALLRTSSGDLGMRRSIKELAQEVGVTPSYLCRVFKQTMGVTIGKYVADFETLESPIDAWQSHPRSTAEHHAGDAFATVPPQASTTPDGNSATSTRLAATPMSIDASPAASPSLIRPEDGPICGAEQAADADKLASFNLDDWLWTEDFDT